jgi:hypothetical protein
VAEPRAALSAWALGLCDRYLGASGRSAEAALIEMETILPPAEYLAAIELIACARPDARADLFARRPVERLLFRRRIGPLRLPRQRIAPFKLIEHEEGFGFYRGPGAPKTKTYLTLFTGAATRPGTWTPVFLQTLDARRVDVLMLRDRSGRHFRNGCPGLAATLPELVTAIDRRVRETGYRRHVALGVSRGGSAALGFARLAGCERAIAFGALPRSDPLRLLAGQAMPPAFDPLCACLQDRPLHACLIHADGNLDDSAHARVLTKLFGGRRLAIEGATDHGVLHHVSAAGALPRLLSLALDGPRPPGPGAPAQEELFRPRD